MPASISYNPSVIPTLKEPPIVHAAHHFDDDTQTLTYEYNGRKIITMTGQGNDSFGYRHTSDGDIQSWPFTQQLYFLLEESKTAVLTFHLSSDVVCMRPNRAKSEEAILGQVGRPLLVGVNGLYDINQDLQIDWHGRKWRWLDDRLMQDENGDLIARLEVELGEMPWFMNLRPHYYRTHLGYVHHRPWDFRPHTDPVSGWCSWEAYRREVTEKDVEGAAEFFSKHFGPYGMKYVQIDDGYEKTPIPYDPKAPIAETWLSTNAQFPAGHRGVIDKIKARGMEAGIWTSASLTNPEFVNEQPQYIVKDHDGECIEGDWLGYLLDCLPETLEKHVQPYYKGLSEMGYSYFKTDQIRHLLFDGLQKACRMGVISNDEVQERFRAFMECARDAMGPEAFFLASWGVLSQVTGICDACRIAIDANPTWAGVRMQLVESARWFHTHRILFVNDPDHICARAKLDWARTLISLVSLSGGLFMLSDPLEAYDDDRIRIIQRCLPPLPTVTGETGPLDMTYPAFTWTKLHGFAVKKENHLEVKHIELDDAINMAGEYATMNDNHPFSSLWAFHIDLPERNNWSVVGRFGTVPLKPSEISVSSLGLASEKEYLLFDFWAERFLGKIKDKFAVPALNFGECQVLCVKEVLDHPQFLASTRHISMDTISVKTEIWNDNELKIELEGVVGTKETYWFHAPADYAFKGLTTTGFSANAEVIGELVQVTVDFIKKAGVLTISF